MYYLLYGFLFLVSLLPFPILYGLSSFVAFVLRDIAGYRKEIVLTNLRYALPEKTEEERKAIARKFYLNLTDSFVETIKLVTLSDKHLLERTTSNLDEFDFLVKEGRNIQFHAGHQFGWEYVNLVTAMRLPIPFYGIYMPINNKVLDRLFYRIRSRTGVKLMTAWEMPKKTKNMEDDQFSIGFIADQNPGMTGSAYWVDFFNRPTGFMAGPEKFAQRMNDAVIFVSTSKKKRGYYHTHFTLITEDAKQLPAGKITFLYKEFMEKEIAKDPAGYLWSHRRWKTPWKDAYKRKWIDVKPIPSEQ